MQASTSYSMLSAQSATSWYSMSGQAGPPVPWHAGVLQSRLSSGRTSAAKVGAGCEHGGHVAVGSQAGGSAGGSPWAGAHADKSQAKGHMTHALRFARLTGAILARLAG